MRLDSAEFLRLFPQAVVNFKKQFIIYFLYLHFYAAYQFPVFLKNVFPQKSSGPFALLI